MDIFYAGKCAKNNILATSTYADSTVLYGDVVIFVKRRLSRGKKMSDN